MSPDMNPAQAAKSTMVEALDTSGVRTMLIPLQGLTLMLPNALVAEVVGYYPPDRLKGTPTWLLGKAQWRGVYLPLISFERLIGIGFASPGHKARILVLYGLKPWMDRLPYYALLVTEVPRLQRASVETLELVEAEPSVGLINKVKAGEREVWVPDIDYLCEQIVQAWHIHS